MVVLLGEGSRFGSRRKEEEGEEEEEGKMEDSDEWSEINVIVFLNMVYGEYVHVDRHQ